MRRLLYITNGFANAENAVAFAELTEAQIDIDAAQGLVNGLTGGKTKRSLQVRIDVLQGGVTSNPPTNISSEFGYTWVDVTWSHPAEGAPDTYRVFRDGVQISSLTGSETLFNDYDLPEGTADTYIYTIRSVVGGVESADSSAESVTTDVPAVTGHRFATAQDILRIKNASKTTDRILDGPNHTFGSYSGISYTSYNGTPFACGPGDKILIKGGTYSDIQLDALPDVQGTKENPVIITPYEGQVRSIMHTSDTQVQRDKDRFLLANMSGIKVTGKYDPIAGTGDKRYLGHDGPYGWAWTSETYGFYFSNNWNSKGTSGIACTIQGYYELEYFECCDGQFTGLKLKYDDPPDPTIGAEINVHDFDVHDTHSEGAYIGKNATSDSQHDIRGKLYNGMFKRCGCEPVQEGNGTDIEIYNLTIIAGDMERNSPFEKFQDKGSQLTSKSGIYKYMYNFIAGVGVTFADISRVASARNPSTISKPFVYANNVLMQGIRRGLYLFNSDDLITILKIYGNKFYDLDYRYDKIYPTIVDANEVISNDSNGPVEIYDNEYDNSGGRALLVGNTANVTQSNNTGVSSYTYPVFENSGYPPNFDFRNITVWSAKIGEQSNFNAHGESYKTAPIDVPGTLDIASIVEDQVITITDFPLDNSGNDFYSEVVGREIRISEAAAEYDNFGIFTLKAIDLVNNTLTVSAPISLHGSLPAAVSARIEQEGTYNKHNYDSVTPNLSDMVTYRSKHYQLIWTGDKVFTAGRNPSDDVAAGDGTTGTYWKLLTWQKPDGSTSYLPPDNFKHQAGSVYEGYGAGYLGDLTIEIPYYAPSNLNVVVAGTTQLDLSWTDNTDNETLFSIERKTGSGGTYAEIDTVAADVTSYQDTTVTEGLEYFYRVRAFNGSEYTDFSNEDSGIPAVPTIPFVVVNLGAAVAGYNNHTQRLDGTSTTDLVDEDAGVTGYDFVMVADADATYNGSPGYSTGSNSGDEPDSVTQSALGKGSDTVWAEAKITGFTAGENVRVFVLSSHVNSAARAEFSLQSGATIEINSYQNTTYVDLGLVAESSGEVSIRWKKKSGTSPVALFSCLKFRVEV